MSPVLILQTARHRDVADDAALAAVARELSSAEVVAATTDPERTARLVDVPVVPATSTSLLRHLTSVDTLVVLGGRPLDPGGDPDRTLAQVGDTFAAGATIVSATFRAESATHYCEQLEAMAELMEKK